MIISSHYELIGKLLSAAPNSYTVLLKLYLTQVYPDNLGYSRVLLPYQIIYVRTFPYDDTNGVMLNPEYKTLPYSFFFLINLFIYLYLFLAVLGLHLCARALSSCGEQGPLLIAVRGPLTVAAPPVAEHRLQTRRLSSRGSRAQLLRGTWDPPRPGLEPVSPALAGRLSTTAPPGKPHCLILNSKNFIF